MSKIYIETSSIEKVANKIDKINSEITQSFVDTENLIRKLNNTWSGKVATKTISNFEKIKNIEENRYQIFNNYSSLLKKEIFEGYETVENINAKLSNLFK